MFIILIPLQYILQFWKDPKNLDKTPYPFAEMHTKGNFVILSMQIHLYFIHQHQKQVQHASYYKAYYKFRF